MGTPRIDSNPARPRPLDEPQGAAGTPASARSPSSTTVAGDAVEAADDRPSWLDMAAAAPAEIKAAVTARLQIADRHYSDKGVVIGLSFDRPVSRDEAARAIYEGGALPRHPEGKPAHIDNVQLVPRGGKTPAREWDLQVPKTDRDWPWKDMKPGVADQLLDAGVPARMPAWIPATSADLIRQGALPPRPGTPGLDVRQHGDVTTWQEGRVTFRFDADTGVVEGYRASADPDLKFFEEERAHLVHVEGRSLAEAETIIEKRYRHIHWSYIAPHMDEFRL